MKRSIILSLSLILTLGIGAQSYKQYNDICYTAKTDTYSQERLKLDIYYREEAENLPVVVWFHGGVWSREKKKSHGN